MSLENERWWLIPDSAVVEIKAALEAAEERQDEWHGQSGCMCDMHGHDCSQRYKDALHTLSSSLGVTEEIPADFRKESAA